MDERPVLANHIEIPETVVKSRTEPDKPKVSNATSKIQKTAKASTITTTAETLKHTARTDKEITTRETTVTVSAKVKRVWQESRNKFDQPEESNVTTSDIAVHTKTSLDGSGHETPHIANLESDDKHIKEEWEKLDKTDQKDKNTKMDKGNISVEGSRQVILHVANRVANSEADAKDMSETGKKIHKTDQNNKNTPMDKGNISVEGSQQVIPHGVNEVANVIADDKNARGNVEKVDKKDQKYKNTKMDKGNIFAKDSRQVIPHVVNKEANVEADGRDFGKERKKLDKTDQKDKNIKMDKGSISVKSSRQIALHSLYKEANAEADVKDMTQKGKQPYKNDQDDNSSKMEKESARYKETYRVPNNNANYINTIKDKSDEDKRQKEIQYYGKDDDSDYIKTKYVLQKFLKDNGPNISAKQRAQLVKERCQTFLKENKVRLNPHAIFKYGDEFLISRRYNVSICYNCKVASTNTKRVLYAIDNKFTDDINSIKQHAAREYSKSREKTFQQVISDKRHVKVMMVREPLERLLSAYRDARAFKGKFEDPSFSFKKYLQLILDTKTKQMNRHIYPYFERCRPCEMEYDFVGLQLNFNDDIKIVLQEIGASGKVDIPKRKKTGYNYVSSDKMLKQYFNKVPNDIIHKLWEMYYKDYYIFGFPYPAHLMN